METLKYFSLGYSPDYSRPLLNLLINKKKYRPQELGRSGLVYPHGRELIDRFAGRVIFPLFDHRGNAIGFSGRLLPGDSRETTSGKYINSPESPVYHKSKVLYGLNWSRGEIKESRSTLVVEGELDLISCWQAGIRNVVAIKGSALTEEHADLLLRFSDKIILALDTDLAGNLAARRGIAQAYRKGLEIRVIRNQDYKDPDEAVRKNPEAFKRQINKAVNIWDYLLTEVFAKYDSSTGEGKTKISREVAPILASISDSIVRAHYIGRVAERLKVPENAVAEEVDKGKPEFAEAAAEEKPQLPEEKSRRQILEERLAALGFSLQPKLLLTKEIDSLLTGNLCRRLLAEYNKYEEQGKKFSLSEFGQYLPKELFKGFSEMVLSVSQEIEEPEKLEKEFELVKKEIKKLAIKDKMTGLSGEIEKKEAQKNYSRLSQKLIELEER